MAMVWYIGLAYICSIILISLESCVIVILVETPITWFVKNLNVHRLHFRVHCTCIKEVWLDEPDTILT